MLNAKVMTIHLIVELIKKIFLYKNELFLPVGHAKTIWKLNYICLIMQENLT